MTDFGRTVAPAGTVIRNAHFPGRAPIDAYGNGGFRFADMSHRGSLLCLPSGIHGWDVTDPSGIDADSLARVLEQADGIEVLLAQHHAVAGLADGQPVFGPLVRQEGLYRDLEA